jgi:D-3-phosphoglycerate dehydrogenase / 2-oxoglutarate reductase
MAFKVVVPNALMRNEEIVRLLDADGCEIVRLPAIEPGDSRDWSGDEIERYFLDADAFLGTFGARPISRNVLEAATKLRVGVSPIIGTETIDVEAATELGIAIGYGAAPENLLGVAEAVVMLTAAVLKNLPGKWEAVRSGGWRIDDPGNMVMHRAIGLIGLGNIGRATAQRLQGWQCRLLAYDPYVSAEAAREAGAELVDLDTLLRESDVVSIMVVLSQETRYLIGARELALMKPTAYLINTSRGPCVDEASLIAALEAGRLRGAAIDTWEQEPTRADNPLRTHPKVIATGHNVGHSEEVYAALPGLAAQNLLKGLRGIEPVCFRNPEVLPRWQARLARLDAEATASRPLR